MVSFNEALSTVLLSAARTTTVETIDFGRALNRILARDIRADADIPAFDRSAVDGYACRAADLPGTLEVIETIPAGKMPSRAIDRRGVCAKIMTGSILPEGADTIIMVEDVVTLEANRISYTNKETRNNIRYKGEDVSEGDIVLSRGTLIRPQHIAVLATIGCTEVPVFRKPMAGILSTGDELVEPGERPATYQIRNSNAYQLLAQAGRCGADTLYFGIVPDTLEGTRAKVAEALQGCDVVLLTGGVSMGDYDFVPAVLAELGVDIRFDSIRVQPGRPTMFGVRDSKHVFGLPGNPVSSFIQFELLVKPLLLKLMGHDYRPVTVGLPLGKDMMRVKTSRMAIVPVFINAEGEVMPVEYHGSAHIHALTSADGVIMIPEGSTGARKGEKTDVRLL
jgi:molybdopterin molybdotransferase